MSADQDVKLAEHILKIHIVECDACLKELNCVVADHLLEQLHQALVTAVIADLAEISKIQSKEETNEQYKSCRS